MRGDTNAVQQLSVHAKLSPDTLQGSLAYAFQQNSSLAIKEILLQHSGCDANTRQAALALAVRHNDFF